METLDPNVFQTLHDQYTKLKSLQKNDKICKETEPVWCANEAKILLDTMIANIENLMANSNIGKENEIFFRLLSMKCTLMYEEAKFLVNIENEEQGQEIMSKTLELLKEYFTKPEITFLVLRIVNHFSFLMLKQGEFDKPHKMLEEADQMYNEIKNQNSDPIFYTAEEIFSPSVSITCKKDTPEKVDRLMTNNLLMLGFVHSKKGNHEKYAFYNHQVLKRQLLSKECEASAWAIKAVKLASYFISKQRFREARHHLSAACHVLEENEAELKNFAASEADVQKWEELQLRFGDVAKCWVKYGLFLFGTSKSRLVSMFYGEPSQFLENLWLPPFEIYPPGTTTKNQTIAQENVNKLEARTGDESIPVEKSKDITIDLELKQTEDNINSEKQEIEPSEQSQIPTDDNDNTQSFNQEDKSERVENSIQDVNNNNENINVEIETNESTQVDHENNNVIESPDILANTNPEENIMKNECTGACTCNKDNILPSSEQTLAEENIEINECIEACTCDKNIVECSETEEKTGIKELKVVCEQGYTVDSVDNTAESLEKLTITEQIKTNENSNVENVEIKSEIPVEETDILKQENIEEIIPSTEPKPQNILNNALHILFTGLNSKDSMLSAANKTSGQAPKIDNTDSQNYKLEEDKNMLLFPTLDLSARESQVTADLIETAEQARALFLFTHSWLKRSKMYFTLKDNPMEYVNAILDLSELYRYLAFYEEDVESQYSVQKRRADALETLSTVLREARPQCYVAVSIELLRELAEVQLEMMGLNLRRLYAAQEGNASHIHSAATDFTLHKMEAMADIHSRLEQFGDNLGHRAEVGDCLSEMSSSEISADSVSHYM